MASQGCGLAWMGRWVVEEAFGSCWRRYLAFLPQGEFQRGALIRGAFVLAEKSASVCEPLLELLLAGPSAQVSTQLPVRSCLPWAFFLEASPSPTRSTCYRTFRPLPSPGTDAQTHKQAAPVLSSPRVITLTSPAAWPHPGPGRRGGPLFRLH